MTPEEKALAAAFLAECWEPVRQWRPGRGSEPVCKECGKALEKRIARGAPRQYCLACRPRRKAEKSAA